MYLALPDTIAGQIRTTMNVLSVPYLSQLDGTHRIDAGANRTPDGEGKEEDKEKDNVDVYLALDGRTLDRCCAARQMSASSGKHLKSGKGKGTIGIEKG